LPPNRFLSRREFDGLVDAGRRAGGDAPGERPVVKDDIDPMVGLRRIEDLPAADGLMVGSWIDLSAGAIRQRR